jgi:putative chitinase
MREGFFASARVGLFAPTLTQSDVDGCNAILDAMAGLPGSFAAYALATAYKETAHTMKPIEEFGGPSYFFRRYDPQGPRPDIARQLGNTQPGDGNLFHGRGLVQLTGRANYAKAAAKMGTDLIGNPSLALQPDIAAKIMRYGMTEGWFTGKKLSSYLPATGWGTNAQFFACRKIINGLDCAAEIAGYAMAFQTYIAAGA